MNGKTLEIVQQNHSGETRVNLQQVLNSFFNQQKNAFQAKRNKLIKQNPQSKKQIDNEIQFLNRFIQVDIRGKKNF